MRYRIISRKYIFPAVGIFACLAASCSRGDELMGHRNESEVTFILKTEKNSAPTRAGELESGISSVEVLVFDPDGGDFLYTAYGQDSENNDNSFRVNLREGEHDLVVLANSRAFIQESFGGAIPAGTPRAEVESRLAAGHTGRWVPDKGAAGYTPMPMWADVGKKDIKEGTTFSVEMLRLLARVALSVKNVDDFVIRSAHVYNYNTRGRLIPDPGLWNGKIVSGPTLPEGTVPVAGGLEVASGLSVDKNNPYREGMYLFEAAEGTDDLEKNTCLVIGAEYGGDLSYYRIELENASSGTMKYLPVKRNFIYDIEIIEVSGPGFPDPDKAFRSQRYGLGYQVKEWENGGEEEYGSGGRYRLDISSTRLVADPSDDWKYITVTTTHPDGWDYRISTSPTEVTGTVDWITDVSLSDDPAPGIPVALGLKTTAYWDPVFPDGRELSPRECYVHITSGNLTNVVKVEQENYFIKSAQIEPVAHKDNLYTLNAIEGWGGLYDINLVGRYPDIEVYAADLVNKVGEEPRLGPVDMFGDPYTGSAFEEEEILKNSSTVAAGRENTATIIVDNNNLGVARKVSFGFYFPPADDIEYFRTSVQQVGRFVTKTGYILALNNVGEYQQYGTWKKYMGLGNHSIDYDKNSYPGSESFIPLPTDNEGCGSYPSGNFLANYGEYYYSGAGLNRRGIWKLPTLEEAGEISRKIDRVDQGLYHYSDIAGNESSPRYDSGAWPLYWYWEDLSVSGTGYTGFLYTYWVSTEHPSNPGGNSYEMSFFQQNTGLANSMLSRPKNQATGNLASDRGGIKIKYATGRCVTKYTPPWERE